jgi:hypothetical protein
MNEELYWVAWRNWRRPDDDQRLTCKKFTLPFFAPILFGGMYVFIGACSDIDACDKAGKVFDERRQDIKSYM